MRIKKDFNLREVCGEYIIVAEGKENIDFCNIISMNESSAYLWKEIQNQDFEAEDLAELLVNQYDVDKVTALRDATTLMQQWFDAGIVER
ncbi:PqqD family protein [Prevotella sp. HCN-7019]|mgnify:CR=1 FL=1|uniref:PqqD family protein n=1 Tax=Prevotella sp. HCN-7019 TaxID=3134668 RepID=UPI0030C555F7